MKDGLVKGEPDSSWGNTALGVVAWCWQRKVGIIAYSMSSSSLVLLMTGFVVLAGMYGVTGLLVDLALEPHVFRGLLARVSGSRWKRS
jgi:hypothetical protein